MTASDAAAITLHFFEVCPPDFEDRTLCRLPRWSPWSHPPVACRRMASTT